MKRTIHGAAAVVALAGALFCAVLVSSSPAAFEGRDGLIAYAIGGAEELRFVRTVKLDGTQNRRLIGPTTRGGGFQVGPSGPRWSPEGARLLFGGHSYLDLPATSLWYASAAGRRITRIPLGLGRVVLYGWDWAPDGRRVVFAASKRKPAAWPELMVEASIYTISIDGTHRERLARGLRPSWSNDGRHIVFEQVTADLTGLGPLVISHGIFVIRRDGTGLRGLSQSNPGSYEDADPSFAPDGRSVVFVRRLSASRGDEWRRIDVSGRRNVLLAAHSDQNHCAPQWTPDGIRLAAVRIDVNSAAGQDVAAFVITSPTGAGERVAFRYPHRFFVFGDSQEPGICDFSWQPR